MRKVKRVEAGVDFELPFSRRAFAYRAQLRTARDRRARMRAQALAVFWQHWPLFLALALGLTWEIYASVATGESCGDDCGPLLSAGAFALAVLMYGMTVWLVVGLVVLLAWLIGVVTRSRRPRFLGAWWFEHSEPLLFDRDGEFGYWRLMLLALTILMWVLFLAGVDDGN